MLLVASEGSNVRIVQPWGAHFIWKIKNIDFLGTALCPWRAESAALFALQIGCSKNVFISPKIPTPKNLKTNNIKNAIISESPVAESIISLRSNLSNMGHVESHVNKQGPPCKAKYSWVTDSEVVPWEKGEKNPHQGVK